MKRKSNGQGHTYKVGNSYRTVIRRGDHIITAMASTQKVSKLKALEKLDQLPNLLGKKSLLPRSIVTVEQFLNDWLENEHKSQIAHSTYKRYQALIKYHITPEIGSIALQRLNSGNIKSVLRSMSDKKQSQRSIQQARAVLSVAMNCAVQNDFIKINPVLRVANPSNRTKTIEPLTSQEVSRLLATFEGTFMLARLHIALLCGLRQGEAVGLRWNDIDLVKSEVRIRKQIQLIDGKPDLVALKTERSERTIPIGPSTIQALLAHKEIVARIREAAGENWVEKDLVFPSESGDFFSSSLDYLEWKRALRLCGIKPRRLHDARHTCATLLYSQGVGIETISRFLGHSTSAITSKLYVHSAMEPLRIAALSLEKILENS